MDANLLDWLNLLVRWAHLIAGIAWIGSSFYFIWLDSALESPATPKKGVEGELWMVHSGGFYQVEKRLIGPGEMPKTLHWFKWEATITWITGFFLLGLVYYMTGGAYLVDPAVAKLSPATATATGVGLLVAAWFVYDFLWQSRFAKNASGAATALSFALVAGVVYGLCHLFSGRGAFIHVGAMFGTLMVLNVWVRILPAQQQMIDATKLGLTPDFTLGQYAKRRSVHNSYMTFPVLFIMLSNHYPATYGHRLNWLVLGLLIFAGAGARHMMISKGPRAKWAIAPVAAVIIALIAMTAPVRMQVATAAAHPDAAGPDHVSFGAARAVIAQRCLTCHSATQTDTTFGPLPGGASFDSPEKIRGLAARIRVRAIETKTMPLGNKTGMTEEERQLLAHWISQGARID